MPADSWAELLPRATPRLRLYFQDATEWQRVNSTPPRIGVAPRPFRRALKRSGHLFRPFGEPIYYRAPRLKVASGQCKPDKLRIPTTPGISRQCSGPVAALIRSGPKEIRRLPWKPGGPRAQL